MFTEPKPVTKLCRSINSNTTSIRFQGIKVAFEFLKGIISKQLHYHKFMFQLLIFYVTLDFLYHYLRNCKKISNDI